MVCGLYCNAMYYQHSQKKIAQLSQQHHDPQALALALVNEGGGSWKGVGIACASKIIISSCVGLLDGNLVVSEKEGSIHAITVMEYQFESSVNR